jgi:hypothetical protein
LKKLTSLVKVDRSVFGTEILGELIPFANLSKEYKRDGQPLYEDGYVIVYQQKLISISRESYNSLLASRKLQHLNN